MSITLSALIFGISNLIWITAAIWLLLHLTAVASVFRGHADLVPAPVRPRAPRGRVIAVILIFVLGVLASFVPLFFDLLGSSEL